MAKKNGKRLAKKTPNNKKSRLTAGQKGLVVTAVLLAVALVTALAYKSLFVRPDVDNRKDNLTSADSTSPNSQNGDDVGDGSIDYGDGIRPKTSGQRKSEDYYTILVLGRDTGGGGNTDTMLLASYDVTNQKAAVMSIPRDTMVNVSWDVKKINSVYNWYGGGEKGIKYLYKEIAQLVGFEPDYQVVVEWEAVGQIVDAIGGVYFDVPYNMDYHDPQQDLVIEQAKGYRLLTGDDAMQVIRWRQNDSDSPYGVSSIGDSGRMELQQDFLKAMIEQLLKPANVMNIGKIAKVFQECVETDLSFQEILWFGKAAVSGGLGVSDVEFFTMPWKGVGVWSRSYQQKLSYVVPISTELLDIVNQKLSPFVETFTRSDLDIMYVNSDGSIGSTSGYVEDTIAAKPPVIPDDTSNTKTDEGYDLDDNGNLIDPETGGVVQEPPETIVIDPSGEAQEEVPNTETDVPEPLEPEGSTETLEPSVVMPEEPDVPDAAETEPEFVIIG